MDVVRNTETIDRIAHFLPLVQNRLGSLSTQLEVQTGLTNVQVLYLEYLYNQGDCTISTLVTALRKAQSSISELTLRLEKKGLVSRCSHSDRRKSLVKLTPKGKRWIMTRQKQQRQALLMILEGLDSDSRQAMLHHLGKLLTLTDRVQIDQGLRKSTGQRGILS